MATDRKRPPTGEIVKQPPERRIDSRHPLILNVTYGDGAGYLAGWTDNISGGGLYVNTAEPIEKGEEVMLSLSFPGLLTPTAIDGVVVRCEGPLDTGDFGVGIQAASESSRRQLARLAIAAQGLLAMPEDFSFRVLVVEDNPLIAEQYKRVLKEFARVNRRRLDVIFAENGLDALDAAKHRAPDLVITDLYMPVMPGTRLIEKLRAEASCRHTPIIVVSSGEAADHAEFAKLGVGAFLKKPIRFGQLLETIVILQCCREDEVVGVAT